MIRKLQIARNRLALSVVFGGQAISVIKGNRCVYFKPANNYSINDNGIFNYYYPHIIIYALNNILLNKEYDIFFDVGRCFVREMYALAKTL